MMKPLWRLIDGGPEDAFYNMALDEAIAATAKDDDLPPTLRFYGWRELAVSIGSFQRTSDLEIDYIQRALIPLVRRPTGGRAILHGDELTYSFSAKNEGPFSGGLMDSYKVLGSAFLRAFKKVGLSAEMRTARNIAGGRASPHCFRAVSLGEITVSGVKIIGSAQRRWPEGFLQQGSIPFGIDKKILEKIFKKPPDFLAGGGSDPSFSGLLELNPAVTPASLKGAIAEAFSEVFGVDFKRSNPTGREEDRARRLLQEKYLLGRWNFRR